MTRKALTTKDKIWTDHTGLAIPVTRISATERLQEKHAHTLLAEAQALEARIVAFKERVAKLHGEVVAAHEAKEGVELKKKTKGNMQWFSFDRGIKVEADVQERIEFDSITIAQAREKLDEFLSNAVKSDVEFVIELVTSAFSTTNGKLDAKKVMGLLGYKHKIKAQLFLEAMALIEKSITRTGSKMYFSVGERQEDGSYSRVNLNFSAA